MKEIIEKIEETNWSDNDSYGGMEGLLVTTNKQVIKIGISSGQSCCEDSGSFSTNDNIKDFIGAEVLGIKLTDTSLNTQMIKERFEYGFDSGGIQFVDIETSKGPLQYAVYNSHNGYYGHNIKIESEQLKHSDYL